MQKLCFRALVAGLMVGYLLAQSDLALAEATVIKQPSTLLYPDFWHTPLGVHRGSPQILKLLLGDKTSYADPQGVACAHMDEHGPDSPQITAFAVNSGKHQIVYNPNMISLQIYGTEGSGPGQFRQPVGIACLRDGRVAVADSGNHRIVLLRFRDKRLEWVGSLGTRGHGPGQFENPRWLAYDSQGRLYVSDTGNNRVQVFSPQGAFLYAFGSNPKAGNNLVQPQAIAVVDPQESLSAEPLGAIYVVDQYHGRLQKLDLQGHFQAQILPADIDKMLVYFSGVALDYYNNIWVSDRSNHQIHKFDKHLQYLDSWGKQGTEDNCLDSPRGVTIWRHFGQVLVLERESAQYFWIGADVRDVRFSKVVDIEKKVFLRLDYRLTERATVDAWIENEHGERVFQLLSARRQQQGAQTAWWDGSVISGGKIGEGHYQLVFHTEALYSSSSYYKKETRKKFVVR